MSREVSRETCIRLRCYEITTVSLVSAFNWENRIIMQKMQRIKFLEVEWQYILGEVCNVIYCFVENFTDFPTEKECFENQLRSEEIIVTIGGEVFETRCRTGVMATRDFPEIGIFDCFRSVTLMTFIYELDPYSLEVYRICKYSSSYLKDFKSYRLTDRYDRKYIPHRFAVDH